ncbi:ribonuclease J, partial [Bacillus solimangrovi]|uniref:ribonuclease J n=1 Tax=Bacillus solimangrovi TaxID=1305675 RepID=UPI000A74D92F
MLKREREDKVKVFALGGLGEIGKDLYVLEYGSDIFVLDAGMKFPEDEMFGVDKVIPDFTYLLENQRRIKGIFLTQGHEDHMGALPYMLQKLDAPVYGTRLTLGLVIDKLKEENVTKRVKLKQVDEHTKLNFEDVTVSFFRTTHNISDSVGICVDTPQGAIVYTGDFKFDQTPVDLKGPNYARLAEIGKKGVLCLLSDSTNADKPGFSLSESVAASALLDAFTDAESRVLVACFSTNLYRIQQVVDASVQTRRKIVIAGKSMEKTVSLAQNLGYLRAPKNIFVSIEELSKLPNEKIAILTSGHQGEPLKALSKIVTGADRQISIQENDTVIIAAHAVAGTDS